MARKNNHQNSIEELIERIAEDNLTGRLTVDGAEFLRWCADAVLNTQGDAVTLEDIESSVTDGAGDQGLDLMYVDHDDETVYLFQSKFATTATTIKHEEIDTFTKLPERLMDGRALRDLDNERIKEAALEFRRCIDEHGFELRLLFVTTKRTTNPIRESLRRWNEAPLGLGMRSRVEHGLRILDADELLKVREPGMRDTDIELDYVEAFRHGGGRTSNGFLSCLIPAKALIEAFDEHRYTIFELNPRGPLGNVKVNKSIRDTLREDHERSNFHLLNNGLTAVCDGFKVDDERKTVRVRNLQIVNGCQTTWTLWDHYRGAGQEGLDSVYVILKLIEALRSVDLASQISQSSNSQSQMRDWDFLFDRSEQKRLQEEFARLGVFYELKRGEQKFIVRSAGSKTNIQNAAQATWAILGHPGEARDRLREIPRTAMREGDDTPYKTVFFKGVRAIHLYLPIELLKRVNVEWKERGEGGGLEVGQVNRKLHAVWLIGQTLLRAMGADSYTELNADQLKQVVQRIDDWFGVVYPLVSRSIDNTVESLTQERDDGTPSVSLRQAFRSNRHYTSFTRDLDYRLEMEGDDYLSNLRSKLVLDT